MEISMEALACIERDLNKALGYIETARKKVVGMRAAFRRIDQICNEVVLEDTPGTYYTKQDFEEIRKLIEPYC